MQCLLDWWFFTTDCVSLPLLDSIVKQLQGTARDVNIEVEFEQAVIFIN